MSPWSDAWMGGLFGDDEVARILAPETVLQQMLAVEMAYSAALGAAGKVAPDLAQEAALAIGEVQIDLDGLRAGCAVDGLPVPALVRQLKELLPARLHPAVHAGLTSQDVMDTALILTMRLVLTVFERRISVLAGGLDATRLRHGSNALMGRTRMQAAVGILVNDRIDPWALPLQEHLDRLDEMRPRLLRLQFGGAAGNRGASGKRGDVIAASMAQALDLGNPPRSWHAMRDPVGELGAWLSLVSGTLGKMGMDLSLMAQQGVDEAVLSGGGSSSAMPHKSNPILAELLVTLARFNAGQLGALHQALVHEQERSGAAWALEWLVLPQMVMATGRGLQAAITLVGQIEHLGNPDTRG